MPTISVFYGIVIQMYWKDHGPPHFHALYAEHEALVDIQWCSSGQPSAATNSLRTGNYAVNYKLQSRSNP